MTHSNPRFEFRIFAQQLGEAEHILRQHTLAGEARENEDLYILSRNTNRMTAKIRSNRLDFKEFLGAENGLEQWNAKMKMDFPLSGEQIEDEILPRLGVRRSIRFDDFSLEEFLDKVVSPSEELVLVHVRKRRQGYVVENCLAEVADVLINGAFIRTIGLESEDQHALKKALETLGIDKDENINYQQLLKRVTGLTQWPQAPTF